MPVEALRVCGKYMKELANPTERYANFQNPVELLENLVELLQNPVELLQNPVELLQSPFILT